MYVALVGPLLELMRDKTGTALPSRSSPTHTDLYSGIFYSFSDRLPVLITFLEGERPGENEMSCLRI